MTDQLRVDLEALRRLSTDLQEMSAKLVERADNASEIAFEDTPSLKAIRRLVEHALPGVQRAFAGRCANMADVSVQATAGIGDTDAHLRQLIHSVAPLSRGGL